MRIFLFGLVLLVFFGCEKREEDSSLVSYRDAKLTVLKFKKVDDVSPLETNRTSLRATVHRDQNRILIGVSDSSNKKRIKYPIYFFVNVGEQSHFFETKTNKAGFLLASIPNEYIDKEINLNIQFFDQFLEYKTTPSSPFHCKYNSTMQYIKSNKPVYSLDDPIIVHSFAQSYQKGQLFKGNTIDTFSLLVTSLNSDTLFKKRFTMDQWSSHCDTISSSVINAEGTYKLTLYDELQYEQTQEEIRKWDEDDCYHRQKPVTQTIFIQHRIKSPLQLQIDPHDTIVTEEEGIQYTLSLLGSQKSNKDLNVTVRYYFIDKIPHRLNGNRGDVFGALNYNHQQLVLEKSYSLNKTKPLKISEKIPFNNDFQQIVIEAISYDKKNRKICQLDTLTGITSKNEIVIQTEFNEYRYHDTVQIFFQPFCNKAILPNNNMSIKILRDSLVDLDTNIATDSTGIATLSYITDTCSTLKIEAHCVDMSNSHTCNIDFISNTYKRWDQVTFDKKSYRWGDTATVTVDLSEDGYIPEIKTMAFVHKAQNLVDYGIFKLNKKKGKFKCLIKKENGIHQSIYIDGWLKRTIPLSKEVQGLHVTPQYKGTFSASDTLKGSLKIEQHGKNRGSNFSLYLFNLKDTHIKNQINHQMQNALNRQAFVWAPISNWEEKLSFPSMAFWGLYDSKNSKLIFSNGVKRNKRKKQEKVEQKEVQKQRVRDLKIHWPYWMKHSKSYSPYNPNCSPYPVFDKTFNKTFAYSLTKEENYSYFNPNITTDENGEAEISIPLPNVEGEWILRAIGSDGEGHLIDFTDTIVTKRGM